MDKAPEWAKKSIGYICYIDSFSKGIDGKDEHYNGDVYGRKMIPLKWHEKDNTLWHSSGFYGGDLLGINKSIPYFNDLGIDLVYLTPIFSAVSNHKYDTIDYYKIDKHFGSQQDFDLLVNNLHANNIKIILDGVFNHTSSEHEWFKNASKGIEKYKDYYKRNEAGYIIFWNGIKSLPVLNHNNPDIQKYFYLDGDSVIKRWLSLGIDGWRLDVAERLGKETLKMIRTAMKEQQPESLLIGEVVETYGKEWLQDGLLDGVMNYVFKGVTTNFLTGLIDGRQYMYELVKMYEEYPHEKLYSSWNIISTHDTNRMLYDINNDESLFKIAAVLQFTYPGIPMIYFGDELGTRLGEKEINNRVGMDWDCVMSYEKHLTQLPMSWEKVNRYNSYHQFYKHIIWLKKTYSVLSEGEFIPIHDSDSVIAFMRANNDKAAFIIINKGENQSVILNIPEQIMKKKYILNCVHGGNTRLHLHQSNLNFYIGGKNAYIFVN